MRVIAGIFFHSFSQRAHRPIRFLRAFFQFHAEKFFHERAVTELPFTNQPRREHRVENRSGNEFMMFFQQSKIVIRAVHNEFVTAQCIEKRVKINSR